MSRHTTTTTTTKVIHVAVPLATTKENGPHLGDLRHFVAQCYGLPDSLFVHIEKAGANDSVRHDVTFTVALTQPTQEVMDKSEATKDDDLRTAMHLAWEVYSIPDTLSIMTSPNTVFDGRTPISLLDHDDPAVRHRVIDWLQRLADGNF